MNKTIKIFMALCAVCMICCNKSNPTNSATTDQTDALITLSRNGKNCAIDSSIAFSSLIGAGSDVGGPGIKIYEHDTLPDNTIEWGEIDVAYGAYGKDTTAGQYQYYYMLSSLVQNGSAGLVVTIDNGYWTEWEFGNIGKGYLNWNFNGNLNETSPVHGSFTLIGTIGQRNGPGWDSVAFAGTY